ncbi:MAG: glycosyltransferase [Candidatus Dadabacteria bacterium]|nr:glycosyltransferase [Candidatus Dadabacteria bacterium]
MSLRENTLLLLNRISPINIKGDAEFIDDEDIKYELSCIINFYKRTNLLKNILFSLADQEYDKRKFEIILAEDRGGSAEGKEIFERFKDLLNIKYITLDKNYGVMGYARNYALINSSGKNILFLDDDTVILQKHFINNLLKLFKNSKVDGIMPKGIASFSITNNRYQYHDSFFPTNRCMAYTRELLKDMGGFISDIVGQEDVEFTVRLLTQKKKIIKSDELEFHHPPLIYEDTNKGKAVGYSFGNLRVKYPFLIWLFLILNGCRYLPLFLLSAFDKFKYQYNFSIGFFQGFLSSFFGKKPDYN